MEKNEMSQAAKEATRKHYLKIIRKWVELIIVIVCSVWFCVVVWDWFVAEEQVADLSLFVKISIGYVTIMLYAVLIIPINGYIGNIKWLTEDRAKMGNMTLKEARKQVMSDWNFFEYIWYEYEDIFFLPIPIIIFGTGMTALFIRITFM